MGILASFDGLCTNERALLIVHLCQQYGPLQSATEKQAAHRAFFVGRAKQACGQAAACIPMEPPESHNDFYTRLD